MATSLDWKMYRHLEKAKRGLKYLEEGLVPFCRDVATQQHKDILDDIKQRKNLQTVTCGLCDLSTLKPDHMKSRNEQCPLGLDKASCHCCSTKDKIACPNNVCGAIYDTIISTHANIPPAPYWRNTQSQQWTEDSWSIAKCFINPRPPRYDQQTSAADIDCMGLLQVIINNKYFHNHVGSNMARANVFSKLMQDINEIFYCSTMELEESIANAYIDDMIAVLQDGKELINRQDAQDAVKKLEELKKEDIWKDVFEDIQAKIWKRTDSQGQAINTICKHIENIGKELQKLERLTVSKSKEDKTDTIRQVDQNQFGYVEEKQDIETQLSRSRASTDSSGYESYRTSDSSLDFNDEELTFPKSKEDKTGTIRQVDQKQFGYVEEKQVGVRLSTAPANFDQYAAVVPPQPAPGPVPQPAPVPQHAPVPQQAQMTPKRALAPQPDPAEVVPAPVVAVGIEHLQLVLEQDKAKQTSRDDTEQSLVSEYDSDGRTGVNRPELKDKDKSEELKQHERALYTKLHEIEDSRNIPFPANDQDVETWYINCTSTWHGAPEHIFYYGIFDTIIRRTRELPKLKYLTLTDMIIGRHKFSMSITEKDITCLKELNSDSEFRKMGSMILAQHAENVCFDKDDFRFEERKSRSFASYIVLDMICRMCVMENIDIEEAYPALEENKGELLIICVSKKRTCLLEYKRFNTREISFDGTSTESLEAENVLDKDDENVKDLIRRYGIEVNETLSHHVLRLMERHSNLEAAKVSFVRSTKTGYDYLEPCIVLYCLGKTLIPYGEDLFPVSLQHPKTYRTFKTDVREGYFTTCQNDAKLRHQELAMGCSIGEKGVNVSGTLGPLVEFVENGDMGFLTARHLFEPTTKLDNRIQGTEVVQPSDVSASSSSDDRICGTVVTSNIGGEIDAALIRIYPDRIPQRGKFIGVNTEDLDFAGFRTNHQLTFDDGAIIDARTLTTENMATRRIIKIGSTTGLTKGTLSTTGGAIKERAPNMNYKSNGRIDKRTIGGQLFVDSYYKKVFCEEGDSGSAVFLVEDDANNSLKCIGMVIGYIKKDFPCVITPIQNILSVLQEKCGEQLRLKNFRKF